MKLTFLRLFMAIALSGFALGSSSTYAADDTAALKQQVAQLNDRIAQLEKQAAQKQQPHTQNYAPVWQSGYVDQWDPFADMELMQNNMRTMMNVMGSDAMLNPREDIKETPKEYVITMDIPGMDKSNIEVKVEDHTLIVSGERSSQAQENQQGKVYRQERSFGHFMRAVPLPSDAKADAVDAQYNNGVLTIKVARSEKAAKPVSQKVTVK